MHTRKLLRQDIKTLTPDSVTSLTKCVPVMYTFCEAFSVLFVFVLMFVYYDYKTAAELMTVKLPQ